MEVSSLYFIELFDDKCSNIWKNHYFVFNLSILLLYIIFHLLNIPITLVLVESLSNQGPGRV